MENLDDEATNIAAMVHRTASLANDIVATLDEIINEAGDVESIEIPFSSLLSIISTLQVQNKLMLGCYELQAETADRLEAFVKKMEKRREERRNG